MYKQYRKRSTIAVNLLISRSSLPFTFISPKPARHAGMDMPRIDMRSRVVFADAAVELNF